MLNKRGAGSLNSEHVEVLLPDGRHVVEHLILVVKSIVDLLFEVPEQTVGRVSCLLGEVVEELVA